MGPVLALVLAASIDGNAVLRHASALAALGPHPWGSEAGRRAAAYVAEEMRQAGVADVALQPFECAGIAGTNVIATLPGAKAEFIVVGAHHDTVPGAPGAYDDGSGVGIVIELGRVLAAEAARPRTIVLASFDGEESSKKAAGPTVGSHAYVSSLGPQARDLVAAFVVEMSGWANGTPVLHTLAYAREGDRGGSGVTPAWLVRAALAGARDGGVPFAVGDPVISWLYQPAVRALRVRFGSDDLSFVQSGLAGIFASDSSFTAFYPHYHRAEDTADRLDADALGRMGSGVLGVVRALVAAPRGPQEVHWFSAFGRVFGLTALLGLAAATLLPGLWLGARAGGRMLAVRLIHAALFAVLMLLQPVPTLWVLLVPNLLLPITRRWWAVAAAALPAAGLAALGVAAWARDAVSGLWLAPWQLAALVLTFALTLVRRTSSAWPRAKEERSAN